MITILPPISKLSILTIRISNLENNVLMYYNVHVKNSPGFCNENIIPDLINRVSQKKVRKLYRPLTFLPDGIFIGNF